MTTAINASPTSTSQRSRFDATIRPVTSLTAGERSALFQLFDRYYEGATQESFEQDLDEKESIGLLIDRECGSIRGFTTLRQLRIDIDGRPLTAFFSGDTIVDESCRSETALGRRWLQHIVAEARVADGRVYWFLISSGYKTYRVLPTLFRSFYPTCAIPTPAPEKRIIDSLARERYGEGYDPARGIIRLPNPTPLRPGAVEVPPARTRDPHIRFFLSANPGHGDGDELACLAEISPANLTSIGRRLLGRTMGREIR